MNARVLKRSEGGSGCCTCRAQLVQLAFAHDEMRDIQAAKLPHVWLVPARATQFNTQKQCEMGAWGAQVELVQQPHVALVTRLELERAQAAADGECKGARGERSK